MTRILAQPEGHRRADAI